MQLRHSPETTDCFLPGIILEARTAPNPAPLNSRVFTAAGMATVGN